MKVKDLKIALENLDDNVIVVLTSDSEGKSFSPLSRISTQYKYTELADGEDLKDYTEDQIFEKGEDCIMLWPLI